MGLVPRRGPKADFTAAPPVVGEIIFATDTKEFGMLDTDGQTIIWDIFSQNEIWDRSILIDEPYTQSVAAPYKGWYVKLFEYDQAALEAYHASHGWNDYGGYGAILYYHDAFISTEGDSTWPLSNEFLHNFDIGGIGCHTMSAADTSMNFDKEDSGDYVNAEYWITPFLGTKSTAAGVNEAGFAGLASGNLFPTPTVDKSGRFILRIKWVNLLPHIFKEITPQLVWVNA